jgi:hypothetical protein
MLFVGDPSIFAIIGHPGVHACCEPAPALVEHIAKAAAAGATTMPMSANTATSLNWTFTKCLT